MSTEILLALAMFAFITSITPGPNNIMIMTSGLNFGIRRSLPHFLGILFGFPLMTVLVGLGLGFVFERYPLVHEIIKIAGVCYLLWLAWKVANSSPTSLNIAKARPFTFIQSILFQWLNPKGWMMVLGAVAAYTTAEGNIYLQVLIIAGMFMLACLPGVGSWLFLGVGLKKLLKSEQQQRLFNYTMAVLLLLSVVPVLIEMWESYFTAG